MKFSSDALHSSWRIPLAAEFKQPYMSALANFLAGERAQGKTIYPAEDQVFAAFNATPFDKVKLVILGQDPYHGPGQAQGLSFSVPPGVKTPPSLKNIFKALQHQLQLPVPNHGCLSTWAAQGVLLLNATLTVEQASAGSHQRRGWEAFTDRAIQALSDERVGLVFLLWGAYAQKKGAIIDRDKHLVLESVHPSPLSAHRGFFDNGHFVEANHFLETRGAAPINWRLPAESSAPQASFSFSE